MRRSGSRGLLRALLKTASVSFSVLILSSLAVAHADGSADESSAEDNQYEWECPEPCSATVELGMECDEDIVAGGELWYQELEYNLFTRPDTHDWDIRAYNTDVAGADIKVTLLDDENFQKLKDGEPYEGCTDVEDLTSARQCIVVRGEKCAFRKNSEGVQAPYRFVVVECLSDVINCPIAYRITRFTDFIEEEPCKVGALACGAFGGVIGGVVVFLLLVVLGFCYCRRSAQAARTDGVDMTPPAKTDMDADGAGEPVTWHGGPGTGLPVTAC